MTQMIKWRTSRWAWIYGGLALVNVLLVTLWVNRLQPVVSGVTQLPSFDAVSLSQYGGDDPDKPIYLAMDGFVYDVTAGRDDYYGPGMPYHYLVGKDSSALLHIAGGAIIRSKYRIVGTYH